MTTLTKPMNTLQSLLAAVPREPGCSAVFQGIAAERYRELGEALRGRPGLRLTYDRGTLEIRTLSFEHEGWVSLLRRLIEELTLRRGLRMKCLRSGTLTAVDADRGFEPDECWYIGILDRIRGVRRYDPTAHPPPDLVVEVDITRSSVDRIALYAAAGVPEVWRLRRSTLTFLRLGPAGYVEVGESPTVPGISPADLMRFLAIGDAEDDNTMVLRFREWLEASER